MEAEWNSTDPESMLNVIRRHNVGKSHFGRRKLRLFACSCIRNWWDDLNSKSREVLEITQRYALGDANIRANRVRATVAGDPPHTTGHAGPAVFFLGGGSTKRSKLGPQRLQAKQSGFGKPRIGQPHAAGNGLGHMPVAWAAACVTDRLTSGNAQANEQFPSTFGPTPLFPVAHPDAESDPLIEFIEQLQLRCQAEVARPAANVTSQFAQTTFHRNAPATAGDLANAVLEPTSHRAMPVRERELREVVGVEDWEMQKRLWC